MVPVGGYCVTGDIVDTVDRHRISKMALSDLIKGAVTLPCTTEGTE